jgi:hypothetical protein
MICTVILSPSICAPSINNIALDASCFVLKSNIPTPKWTSVIGSLMILQFVVWPKCANISCKWKYCTLRDNPPILILKISSGDLLLGLDSLECSGEFCVTIKFWSDSV